MNARYAGLEQEHARGQLFLIVSCWSPNNQGRSTTSCRLLTESVFLFCPSSGALCSSCRPPLQSLLTQSAPKVADGDVIYRDISIEGPNGIIRTSPTQDDALIDGGTCAIEVTLAHCFRFWNVATAVCRLASNIMEKIARISALETHSWMQAQLHAG